MLAQEQIAVGGQCHRVLEIGADSQDRRQRLVDAHRQRGVAAGAAQDQLALLHDAHDRVVHVAADRTVVHQQQVGDRPEPPQRVPLVDADRLVGQVAAGGYHRAAKVVQHEVVQRGGRQHDAQAGAAGRHGGSQVDGPAAPQQHDGRFRRAQQPRLQRREHAVTVDQRQVRIHQRERLLVPPLAPAQAHHRLLVAGVDQQMKAAESLDGHDQPPAQRCHRPAQRGFLHGEVLAPSCGVGAAVPQRQPRPALRTRVGLGMEAPVAGIAILRQTARALREAAHGGMGAVVRKPFDDAVARAAVRAVGERIAVAAIRGVEDVRNALRAGSDVGQDQRPPGSGAVAGADLEPGVPDRVEIARLQALDGGARRSFPLDAEQESLQALPVARQ